MEYITNLRMEKARELLLGTDWLIKDIAKEVGYANALYFSRVFKQTFNVSPQVFRQRNIV
ncbi:transcriptional regulator, AraC family [Amygdalobacter nucleatus]|uniref:Transcriptional regulator, AraC family n=2 Tax=Amygdalobacter nucleatus TaxID=3029274 RepID=A0A133YDG7_9FIRM|nr:transcriptional regulator, AraC family [Amygdalobacter nucleatus]